MSYYLEILSRQKPFAYGYDNAERSLFSANYDATAASPVDKFEEEIVKLLTDAGLGTLNVDIFVGPLANAPDGDGPFIHLIDTGGVSPLETHNGTKYERLSFQIIVRGRPRSAARTRAFAAWAALDGKRSVTVSV